MRDCRSIILGAFKAALEAADPEFAVATAIRIDQNRVTVDGRKFDESRRFDVIAIGKAAVPMFAGAISGLGQRTRRGFVITKDGHVDRDLPEWVTVRTASHPVLDQRSVDATEALIDWLEDGAPDVPTICLISGGGSALLEAPVESVPLTDFQTMTRLLLNAGADIHELNAVRSRVSRVKGGGLRLMIRSDAVVTLALSDVLGNDTSVIASGPTVSLKSTRADAFAVIANYKLAECIPGSILSALERSPDQVSVRRDEDHVAVIADNQIALAAAEAKLAAARLKVRTMPRSLEGESRDAAVEWVSSLKNLPPSVDMLLGGGELTVTVRGDGLGGRNTEFALAAAIELENQGTTGWTVGSLATDGQDALTGVAGAIVDEFTTSGIRAIGLDPEKCLARNDSLRPLIAVSGIVDTGPTGTNVNDLYFAVRSRAD